MKAYDPAKRAIDVVIGGLALLVSLPLQLALAAIVHRKLGAPVLFRQRRPGKDEEVFELVKFRTMLEPDEARGLITDAQRLTPFGIFLRSTSLDELPSLINVVRGDMSLVGPRPLMPSYLNRYSHRQARRHDVRPGITGLAQVSGRNTLDWTERLEMDVRYVESRSLWLDLRIVLKTIRTVLGRSGISDGSGVTMSEFRGDH